jgi:choline dehydrogenase-like flavoprotein
MSERTDVCIVGSGFGGAIMAYYLAKAGQRVVVLERGPKRKEKSLQVPLRPRELLEITHTFNGNGATVLVGTAVGGGSLVYSGVSLRAPSFVFGLEKDGRRIWPQALTRAELDPFYRRAEQGLGVHQLGFDEVAKRGGIWGLRMNELGLRVDPIRQATTACIHCGFCNTGCRFHRKNHLTLNYLRGARRAGAEIRPRMEAVHVRPTGDGYTVTYGEVSDDSLLHPTAPTQTRELEARRVVLGGGAIGSAGILLRSREALPGLSDQVGRNLSANGDLALMALLPKDDSLPGRGRVDQHQGVAMDTICYEFLESHHFVIITQHELSLATVANGDPGRLWWGLEKKRLMRHYGSRMVGLAVLGIDGSPGTVQAAGPDDEVRITPAFGVSGIDFPIDPVTRKLFDDARRIVGDLVRRMGGELVDLTLNPSPTYDETAFFAHPLGTARMGDTPDLGVVDADGEVHGHPGLYVTDGAAVPTALGVNPSLTIAALAERAAVGLVRKLGAKPASPPDPNPFVERRRGEAGGPRGKSSGARPVRAARRQQALPADGPLPDAPGTVEEVLEQAGVSPGELENALPVPEATAAPNC